VETPALPPTPAPPTRKKLPLGALAVALVSDVLSVGFEFVPPLQIGLDLATGLVLWAMLGWRWPLLPALIVEAIPGLALFPTWSLVVGALPFLGGTSPPAGDGRAPGR